MKRSYLKELVLVLIISTLAINSLKSQEIQIPFCDKYHTITPAQVSKISFFNEISGFKEAYLYLNSDTTYTIEIFYIKNGQTLREKKSISQENLNQLCNEITEPKPTELDDQNDFGQDGRRRLIISSMTYALGYYGWAVPVAFDAQEGKAYTTSYMFIGAASFFIPFMATRDKEVTWGMAKGYSVGSSLGIIHGWSLSTLLLGEEMEGRTGLGISVATSLTEGLIGYSLARKHNFSYSRMNMIGYGGTWGALQGLGLPYLLNSEEPRIYGLSSLAFSGLGMYAGNYFSSKYSITNGDATVINTIGVLGTYVPVSILNSINDDFDKTQVAFMMLGSLAGLSYGIHKTKTIDYDNQQGNIISLGSLAGYFTGLGFAYITESDYRGYLILGSLGTTLGFVITDQIVKQDIRKKHNRQKATLNLEFNPYPMYGIISGKNRNTANSFNYQEYNYLVKMRLRF
ncbi:MAG: hypothetical protein AB9846_07965 [Tenuifilaceae bacterium]